MGLRDILLFALVFGGIPFILRDPRIGLLYWVWLGLMNPQSMTHGPSNGFPFALVVAIATAVGILLARPKLRLDARPEVLTLLAFVAWFTATTPLALEPDHAWSAWQRAFKVQVFTFVAIAILSTKQDLQRFVWVMALSLGLLGAKGGLYTIATGGAGRVWGPGGFLEDNNQFALALAMTVPLLYYLAGQVRGWLKLPLAAIAILTGFAILGSHSRGAFLAIAAMLLFLWLKSRQKLLLAPVLIVLVPTMIVFMPESWVDRMKTIGEYQADGSAMGRITAWKLAARVAAERFPGGGGFEFQSQFLYERYLNSDRLLSMHSIWFQALGDQGYVGLALFIATFLFSWRSAAWVIKKTRGRRDLAWAGGLAAMIQVSYVGYFVGGSFVNLAYWDMPYYLLACVVLVRRIVAQELRTVRSEVGIPNGGVTARVPGS